MALEEIDNCVLRHLKQAIVSEHEGKNSSDGLIVGRMKKPYSIHHLHTEHPPVLSAPSTPQLTWEQTDLS